MPTNIERFFARRDRFSLLAITIVLIAVLIFDSRFLSAYTTDKSVYLPPQYLQFQPPAAGASYGDPVFGTTIKRLTDSMHMPSRFGGMVQSITPEYSTMPPLNKDNTRLLLLHFGYFGLYDGAGNYLKDLPLEITPTSEPRWSRTDPNVFYYINGNQLKTYNVSTGAVSVAHSFSEYAKISGNGESDISFDGDHFVLAGDSRYIFLYEISTGTKGGILDANGHSFDSMYITPDGNVTVTWYANGSSRFNGVELFDRNMNFKRQLTHAGGHMDVSRDVDGTEVLLWVNAADSQLQVPCENGVMKIRLSDAKQTCLWTGDWSLATHVSAPDNSGWFFIETYAPGDPIPPAGWFTYTDEILQIKMDGSEIRRLAHHRSRPFNSYTYQPRTSVNHDGTKLVFGSNFGLQAQLSYPTEYSDAYMIDLSGAVTAPTSSTGSTTSTTGTTSTTSTTSTTTSTTSTTTAPTSTTAGTVTRIQENSSSVAYSTGWHPNTNVVYSGSSATGAMDAGARASLTFSGTGVTVVGYKDEWSGIARISIDGVQKGQVDTYASPYKAQVNVYSISGLSPGTHTLVVEATGTKNSSSGGSWIWLDAFDVTSDGTSTSITTTSSSGSTTSTGSTTTSTTTSTPTTSTSAPTTTSTSSTSTTTTTAPTTTTPTTTTSSTSTAPVATSSGSGSTATTTSTSTTSTPAPTTTTSSTSSTTTTPTATTTTPSTSTAPVATGSSEPNPAPTTTSPTSTSESSTTGTSTNTTSAPITPASGGQSLTSSGGGSLQLGSATVIAAAGQVVPSGLAIFGFRQNGVLVSEAGVPGVATTLRGRIYADVSGVVNTGLALANPNDSAATVSFFFTDGNGTDFGNGTITIPAHGQIARFLEEGPFNAPRPTNGTFSFSSNVPVSAIAIRGLTNERSEFLVTTLPVADPNVHVPDSVFFPHFADGGGWTTQFVLVNPSDQAINGTLSFFAQGTAGTAAPSLNLNIDGATLNQLTYSIPARSAKRFSTVSAFSEIKVGSARVTPALWNAAPVGVAIFSFKNAGITVSEAGTPSMGVGNAFRMYAEADQNNAIRTGVAIENAGPADTSVTFELTRLDGTSAGFSRSLVIPSNGQRALFLNEIPGFESLPMPFKGVLRISSANPNLTVLGMRGRWNERGDFIFTTTPATNENAPANSKLVFPHIANGGGYSTQFIMFSGTSREPASGSLQLFSQTGGSLNIGLQ